MVFFQDLHSIAMLNNIIFATGGSQVVLSSDGGSTWTSDVNIDSSCTNEVMSFSSNARVYSLGSQFIAIGRNHTNSFPGGICTSTDGRTWTYVDTSTGVLGVYVQGLVFDGTTYVAIDGANYVATATNLGDWSGHSSATLFSGGLKDIIYDGSQIVAITPTAVLYGAANDPLSWTSVTVTGATSLNSIAFDGTTYLAVGSNGEAFSSTDLSVWNTETTGTSEDLQKVVVGTDGASGKQFVMTSYYERVFTRNTGGTWAMTNEGSGFSSDFYDFTHDGSQFIALGAHGGTSTTTQISTSSDGITWSAPAAVTNMASVSPTKIGFANTFYLFGVSHSADMSTWTAISDNTSVNSVLTNIYSFYSFEYINSKYVAAHRDGIAMSDDLSTWSATTWPGGVGVSGIMGVASVGSSWVVLGNDGSTGASKLMHSVDGSTWTDHSAAVAYIRDEQIGYSDPKSLTSDGTTYVISDVKGNFHTSTDGLTWTQLARSNIATNVIASGLTVDNLSPYEVTFVVHDGQRFFGLGQNKSGKDITSEEALIYVSSDGMSWDIYKTGIYHTIHAFQVANSTLIMGGANGFIATHSATFP